MNLFKACKDCTDRELGCHSWCETYLNARAELDRCNRIAERDRKSRDYSYDIYRRNLDRHIRRRRKG